MFHLNCPPSYVTFGDRYFLAAMMTWVEQATANVSCSKTFLINSGSFVQIAAAVRLINRRDDGSKSWKWVSELSSRQESAPDQSRTRGVYSSRRFGSATDSLFHSWTALSSYSGRNKTLVSVSDARQRSAAIHGHIFCFDGRVSAVLCPEFPPHTRSPLDFIKSLLESHYFCSSSFSSTLAFL